MQSIKLLEKAYSGKRAELKRSILNQALSCFLEEGIDTTTIEMICERSEASVGAIYHHFKNKDGIITALFFVALDDQAQRREDALSTATHLKQGIMAIVESYIDWVVDYPDFARFLYMAKLNMVQNSLHEALTQKNIQRNTTLKNWYRQHANPVQLQTIPYELLLSLVIGATENYCRAWLANRVKTSPQQYKQILAESAWMTVACLE